MRSERPSTKKPDWHILLALLPIAFLTLFFVLPVFQALSRSLVGGSIGLAGRIPLILRTVGFTYWQAILSTLLTLLIGLPAAYLLYKFDFPGRKILTAMTAIPFILPTVVVAAGISAFIGPHGWANLALQQLFSLDAPPIKLAGTLPAILIAHIFYNLTVVIRLVGTAWSSMNPRLDQAARTLGASPWQSTLRVSYPLMRPVITSAALLVFIFDFTSFGVILLLGGPQFSTLEVEIYRQAMSFFNIPLASLLSIVQMGFTLLFAVIYQYFSSKPFPVIPPGEQQSRKRLATGWQRAFASVMVVVLLVLIAAPLISLAGSSVMRTSADLGQRGLANSGLTLDYYRKLGSNSNSDYFYVPPLQAIWNSLKYASFTAVFSLLLGLLLSYSTPVKSKIRQWMESILLIPLGTSAVTMGLGYILFFNDKPFTWGNSQWLIPMAHTLVALPFVVRGILPALAAIPPSYRQSAATLGASPRQVIRLIDLPVIRRSMLSSLVFAFTISLGEFGATSFLTRPEFPTLPVAIFRYLSLPGGMNYGQAMAMSTILMLSCAAGIFFIENTLFVFPEKPRL